MSALVESDVEEERFAPPEQARTEDALGRADRRARGETLLGGDVVGDEVGLLSGKATLLDGEGRHVAGGIDVRETLDAAVGIGGEKPPPVAGQTGDARPAQLWRGDGAVGLDGAVEVQFESAVGGDGGGNGAAAKAHAAVLENAGDERGGVGAEELERRAFGGDERDVHAHAVAPGRSGGHEGELVERQRPGAAGGNGEQQMPDAAGVDVGKQAPQLGHVALVAEGESAGNGGRGAGAEREDEQVVAQMGEGGEAHAVIFGGDGLETIAAKRDAEVLGDGTQVVAVRRGRSGRGGVLGEDFAGGGGAVGEARLGREEGDAGVLAEEVAQSERGLKRCEPASGNENVTARIGIAGTHTAFRMQAAGAPIIRREPRVAYGKPRISYLAAGAPESGEERSGKQHLKGKVPRCGVTAAVVHCPGASVTENAVDGVFEEAGDFVDDGAHGAGGGRAGASGGRRGAFRSTARARAT